MVITAPAADQDPGREADAPAVEGSGDAASARSVALRGLTAFALVWQVLWVAAEPDLWPLRQPLPLLGWLVGLAVLAWAVLLLAHLRRAAWIDWAARVDVAALLLAATAVCLSQAVTALPVWGAGTNLLVLALGSAGLLLPLRPAVAIVCVGVLVDLALVTETILPDPTAPQPQQNLLYAAFALTAGVVTVAARVSLTRAAARVDEATASAARLEADRAASESAAAAIREQQRLLHGTVLNTLVAIERGGLADTPQVRARLYDRCRESVAVLQAVLAWSSGGTPVPAPQVLADDIASELGDLRAAGVSVDLDCDPLDDLPAPVYLAVRTAVREALSNVQRHSRARETWVQARVYRVGGGTSLEVEIGDDGRGFDPMALTGRYGVIDAITEPMHEVGGRASIESDPILGTRVRLRWEQEAPTSPESAFVPSTAVFAVPVLTVFAVYTTLVAVLGSSRPGVSVTDLGLLTVLLGLYALVVSVSRRGPVPAWTVAVCVVGGFTVTGLVRLNAVADGPWSDWSSVGVAALFLVLAAGGPPWAWAAVLASWLVLQGDVVGELLSPGTAVLVAGALFGRSVRRAARRLEVTLAHQRRAAMALAVADRRVNGLRARYGPLGATGALDLLLAITSGTAEPEDPQVRHRAAVEERFIRNVIQVDERHGPVSGLAIAMAGAARARGVALSVHVPAVAEGGALIPDGVRRSLLAAIAAATPVDAARMSAGLEGDMIVLRLVASVPTSDRERMRRLPVPGLELDPLGPTDGPMLWEARLRREERS